MRYRTATMQSFFDYVFSNPAAEHKKNVDCCRHSENKL